MIWKKELLLASNKFYKTNLIKNSKNGRYYIEDNSIHKKISLAKDEFYLRLICPQAVKKRKLFVCLESKLYYVARKRNLFSFVAFRTILKTTIYI